MTDFRAAPTPAQLMADNLVLTPSQVATVLGLTFTRGAKAGQPDRRRVLELVATGALHPVDPSQQFPRLTFSTSSIARYLNRSPQEATQ